MADIPTLDDMKRLLDSFKSEIVHQLAEKLKTGKIVNNTKWIRSKDVCRKLSVSEGTLRKMRNNGTIKFTKVEGIHFYKEVDLITMMEPR